MEAQIGFARFYDATLDKVYTRLGWHVELVDSRRILPLPSTSPTPLPDLLRIPAMPYSS